MAKRTKLVEVTCKVRVPKDWSAAHTKHEVSQQWYGEIYAIGPQRGDDLAKEAVIRPRWVRARVVPEGE